MVLVRHDKNHRPIGLRNTNRWHTILNPSILPSFLLHRKCSQLNRSEGVAEREVCNVWETAAFWNLFYCTELQNVGKYSKPNSFCNPRNDGCARVLLLWDSLRHRWIVSDFAIQDHRRVLIGLVQRFWNYTYLTIRCPRDSLKYKI